MASQSNFTSSDDIAAAAADAALLDRCFAGEVEGWKALYEACHHSLQGAIRIALGSRAKDRDLLEEMTAQVWYALVDQNAALLASFRAERHCRLTTFVAAVAKNLVRNYLRGERRRRTREADMAMGREEVYRPLDADLFGLVMEELRATLTSRESGFFEWCLTANAASDRTFSGSENSDHQLRHRLRKKFRRFFNEAT